MIRMVSAAVMAASTVIYGFCEVSSLVSLADRLEGYRCISGEVRYQVELPSSPDPVTYAVSLEQGPGDGLAPASYLIDWRLEREVAQSSGFSSYYGGDHYRYRDLRLQEYHHAADSIPFHVGAGVQNQAQFVELLPAYMARTLRDMAADTSYICKIREGNGTVSVSGVRRLKGYDAFEFDYTFDAKTGLPVKSDFLYNPASISEQVVTAAFRWNTAEKDCPELTEEALMARYPEVFEKFRTSNFRVESLLGQELPEFTAPTLTGERYTHHHGEGFRTPVVIAFIDPDVETAKATVKDLRKAQDEAPADFQVLYIFNTREIDPAEAVFDGEKQRINEQILIGASSMIRDCGVNSYPTILIADSRGKVKQIVPAYNKELPTIVIQQTSVAD